MAVVVVEELVMEGGSDDGGGLGEGRGCGGGSGGTISDTNIFVVLDIIRSINCES